MREISPGEFAPNFGYRYLTEDVPFGLAVAKGIAQLADVETLAIDAVLRWAGVKLNKMYLTDGRLDGPDVKGLPIPQNYGVRTLSDLVNWYAQDGRPAVLAGANA